MSVLIGQAASGGFSELVLLQICMNPPTGLLSFLAGTARILTSATH